MYLQYVNTGEPLLLPTIYDFILFKLQFPPPVRLYDIYVIILYVCSEAIASISEWICCKTLFWFVISKTTNWANETIVYTDWPTWLWMLLCTKMSRTSGFIQELLSNLVFLMVDYWSNQTTWSHWRAHHSVSPDIPKLDTLAGEQTLWPLNKVRIGLMLPQ